MLSRLFTRSYNSHANNIPVGNAETTNFTYINSLQSSDNIAEASEENQVSFLGTRAEVLGAGVESSKGLRRLSRSRIDLPLGKRYQLCNSLDQNISLPKRFVFGYALDRGHDQLERIFMVEEILSASKA